MKKTKNKVGNSGEMLYNKAEDKAYQRKKKLGYAKLGLQAVVMFFLGILTRYLIGLL